MPKLEKIEDLGRLVKGISRRKKISQKEKRMLDTLNKNLQTLFLGGQIIPILDGKRFGKDYEKNVDKAMVWIQRWKKRYGEVI